MDVTDDLARVLFELEVMDTTAATTRRITHAITCWAHERGWAARTEARVGVPDESEAGRRLGFVDVVIRRGGDGPDLAIEIDSADKPWSVNKLRHASAAGMRGIWIRWGDADWATAYRGIDVIQLQIQRRAATIDVAAQLPLWQRLSGVSAPGSRAGRR